MSDSNMVPSNPVGESFVVEPAAPVVPAYMIDVGDPVFWSNIDIKSDEGKALVMKCHGDVDRKGGEMIGKTFPTKWLLAHPVEMTNRETGEVSMAVRTVLISPDGVAISFVSYGVLRSLKLLVMLYGRGPWEPALPIEIRQVNTSNSKRTYTLTVSTPQPKTAKGGK